MNDRLKGIVCESERVQSQKCGHFIAPTTIIVKYGGPRGTPNLLDSMYFLSLVTFRVSFMVMGGTYALHPQDEIRGPHSPDSGEGPSRPRRHHCPPYEFRMEYLGGNGGPKGEVQREVG